MVLYSFFDDKLVSYTQVVNSYAMENNVVVDGLKEFTMSQWKTNNTPICTKDTVWYLVQYEQVEKGSSLNQVQWYLEHY